MILDKILPNQPLQRCTLGMLSGCPTLSLVICGSPPNARSSKQMAHLSNRVGLIHGLSPDEKQLTGKCCLEILKTQNVKNEWCLKSYAYHQKQTAVARFPQNLIHFQQCNHLTRVENITRVIQKSTRDCLYSS